MKIRYVKMTECGSVVKFSLSSQMHGWNGCIRIPAGAVIKDSAGNILEKDNARQYWFVDKNGLLRLSRISQKKEDNLDSLKRSFGRLRDLINANAVEPEKILFMTMTYDPKRLKTKLSLKKVSKDMRNCFYRMRKMGYVFEYIYTVEQQGNGNWHTHVLFFFNDIAPYIKQIELEGYWQHGFIKVSKRFDDGGIDNIGAYVVADLTYGQNVNEHGKVKIERLLSYPSGMHLYRCSHGIKRPTEYAISEIDYETITGESTPIFEKLDVHEYGGAEVYHKYEHYRLKDLKYFGI